MQPIHYFYLTCHCHSLVTMTSLTDVNTDRNLFIQGSIISSNQVKNYTIQQNTALTEIRHASADTLRSDRIAVVDRQICVDRANIRLVAERPFQVYNLATVGISQVRLLTQCNNNCVLRILCGFCPFSVLVRLLLYSSSDSVCYLRMATGT